MNIRIDQPLLVILAVWLLARRQPKKTTVVDPRAFLEDEKRHLDSLYTQLAFQGDTWFDRKLSNILRNRMLEIDRALNFYKMLNAVAYTYVPKTQESSDASL